MQRIELQDLVPPSVVSNESRKDVLQRLITTAASAAVPQVGDGTLGGTNAAAGASLSSLLEEPVKTVTQQMTELTRQITNLGSTQQTQIGAMQDNTQAVTQNTASKGSGASVAGTMGHIASSFLGGGLGLSPIISGLLSLFGGGSKQQTIVAPTPFRLPAPVHYEAGLTGGSSGQIAPVDYGQTGQARAPAANAAPQVNIQVNAMDSRSFLDHSDEIAKAVREAMLSSNSLNDVISDL